MRGFYYDELERIKRQAEGNPDMTSCRDEVNEAVCKVSDMRETARREGILSLEEEYSGSDDKAAPAEMALKKMLKYLVDGREPDLIEHIGLSVYATKCKTPLEKLKALIYIQGVLMIQEETESGKIREKLGDMLSDVFHDEAAEN
ncbi:MAG: hypothetical protein ACI4CS_04535, partial [Candidatus Weimeria sp.]